MKPRRRRVALGCLLIIALFILLGLSAYVYIRVPRFSGSTPVAIEITMYPVDELMLETNAVIQPPLPMK